MPLALNGNGAAASGLSPLYIGVNAQTGTSYTLIADDNGQLVTCNNGSAITVTVPPNVFSAGAMIAVAQLGAGQVSIAAGSGVTIYSNGSKLKINGQYSAAQLYCLSSNTFLLAGNTAA